jgi:hypothetical protein
MHATIQKPIEEILACFKPEEKVFVVGCGNCAAKCHSGGEAETREMADRLKGRGVPVAGWACTDNGVSLCKLSVTRKLLREDHKSEVARADSFMVIACGQGIHTIPFLGGKPLRMILSPSIALSAVNVSLSIREGCARSRFAPRAC